MQSRKEKSGDWDEQSGSDYSDGSDGEEQLIVGGNDQIGDDQFEEKQENTTTAANNEMNFIRKCYFFRFQTILAINLLKRAKIASFYSFKF